MLYQLIFLCLMSFGIYNIVTHFFIVPSKRTYKLADSMIEKEGIKIKLNRIFVYPIGKTLARFITMDKYKHDKLERDLKRAGFENITPEQYYANAIVISLYVCVLGVLFILTGIKFVALVVFAIAILVFFQEIDSLKEKLKKRNDAIRDELPQFIRTYNYSLDANRKNVDIIEKYRRIAGEAFWYDLDVLITDLKTGNEEDAFMKFDNRVNIPELSSFVNGVIGQIKGIDQKDFFKMLEREMKVLSKERIKREIGKRPAKVKKATVMVGVMMFVIYLYPIVLDLKNGLSIFN